MFLVKETITICVKAFNCFLLYVVSCVSFGAAPAEVSFLTGFFTTLFALMMYISPDLVSFAFWFRSFFRSVGFDIGHVSQGGTICVTWQFWANFFFFQKAQKYTRYDLFESKFYLISQQTALFFQLKDFISYTYKCKVITSNAFFSKTTFLQ